MTDHTEQPEQIDREAKCPCCGAPCDVEIDPARSVIWKDENGDYYTQQIHAVKMYRYRRLGIEQGKRMASGEVEAIKRELAERTRYAMGILADLREVVDLGDESSESVLGYCDDLETTVHNIAAVASHLPAPPLTEQQEEG